MTSLFRSKKNKDKDGVKESKETTPKSQRTVSDMTASPHVGSSPHLAQAGHSPREKPPNFPWTKHPISGETAFPRYGHACNSFTQRENTELYIYGGLVNHVATDDVYVLDITEMACRKLSTTGESPSPRVGHASLLIGNAFIVFGGDTKLTQYDALDDTLYLLNTHTQQWATAITHGARPQGRYGHSLNIIGANLFVFGGQVEGFFFNDLISFDLNTLSTSRPKWELLPQNGSVPGPRTNHACVSYQDRLYLFGGTNGSTWYNDTWCYETKSNAWRELDCIGYIPSPREGHSATMVGDVAYFFGGRSQDGTELGDLAAFKFSTRRWFTFQNMGPSPLGRSGHSLSAIGNKVIVLGGESSAGSSEDVKMAYVLDTGKIRYPPDDEKPPLSPMNRTTAPLSGPTDRPPIKASPNASGAPPNSGFVRQQRQMPDQPENVNHAQPPTSIPVPVSSTREIGARQVSAGIYGRPTGQDSMQYDQKRQDPFMPRSAPPSTAPPQQPFKSDPPAVAPHATDRSGLTNHAMVSSRSPRSTPSPGAKPPSQVPQRVQHSVEANGASKGLASSIAPSSKSDLQDLRNAVRWYAAELELAKKQGYKPSQNPRDGITSEDIPESHRELWEMVFALRNELHDAKAHHEAQTEDISATISIVEQERDAALAEAAFAKAKLAGTVPEYGEKSRYEDVTKRLASALLAKEELSRKADLRSRELLAEKEAHKATREQAGGFDAKLQTLEESLERHMTELTAMRKRFMQVQNELREEQAARIETLIERDALQNEVDQVKGDTEMFSSMKDHFTAIDGAKAAILAATDRADVAERHLQDAHQSRNELAEELSSLKSQLQEYMDLAESSRRRVGQLEEQLQHTAKEADASKKVMLDGMSALVVSSEQRGTGTPKGIDDSKLRDQLEQSWKLQTSLSEAAKEAESKLSEAVDRSTHHERQHLEVSRDLSNVQKRVTELLIEVGALKRQNQELQSSMLGKERELATANLKHSALQQVLSDRAGGVRDRKSLGISVGTADSADIARLQELEARLEESERAQKEATAAAKAHVTQTEKAFRDRLEQLESDYANAVQYVRETEKSLRRMKEEVSKYKTQNAKLSAELEELRSVPTNGV